MADFLSNVLGNEGIAKVAGDKVGDLVEETVKKALSGGAEKKQEEKKQEEKKEGGFNAGDVLSLVEGKKAGKGEGLGVKNVIGGFFK